MVLIDYTIARKPNKLTVEFLWHPQTKDHIAIVNGVQLRIPHAESDYPRFIDLDFSTAKRARQLYERVAINLAGYQTVMTHGNGVGIHIKIPS